MFEMETRQPSSSTEHVRAFVSHAHGNTKRTTDHGSNYDARTTRAHPPPQKNNNDGPDSGAMAIPLLLNKFEHVLCPSLNLARVPPRSAV
jgi:hypothetical protein